MAIRYLSGINVDSNTLFVDDANNRVGIGTASPTQALDVTGRAYISSGASIGTTSTAGTGLTVNGSTVLLSFVEIQQGNLLYLYSSGNTYYSQIYQSGQNLILSPYSNVGIGTTSPAVKFVVSNAGASGFEVDPTGGVGGGPVLQAYNRSTSAYMAQSYYALSHTFNVGSGGSTRAVDITSSGDVGIGISDPAGWKVRIDSTTGANLYLYNSVGTGNRIFFADQGWSADISHSAGNLLFKTAGATEVMRITSAGNVGIGTTSPGTKLVIVGGDDAAGVGVLEIQTAGGTNLKIGGNSTYSWIQSHSSKPLYINQLGNNVILNSGGGNVGIGTTSPGYKLDVAGTSRSDLHIFRSNQSAPTADAFIFRPADNTIALGTANSERMRISSAGALKLNAYGSGSNTGTATQRLAVDASGNVIEIPIGSGPVDGNGTANYVTKWSDADTITNSVIYENGGNIGIGVTNADYPLTVGSINVGGAGANLGLILNSVISTAIPSSSVKAIIGATNSGFGYAAGSLLIQPRTGVNAVIAFATEGTEKVRITHDGNVGIGTTSPSSILDASLSGGATSGFRFKGWSDASTPYLLSLGTQTYPDVFQVKSVNGLVTMGVVGATGAAPDLVLQTNTTERMRITSAGNVGIGTTSPTKKLQIGLSDAAHADEGILLQSPSGYGEGAIYHDYGQSTGLTAFKLLNTYAGAQIALSQDSYSSTGSPSSLRFYTAPQAGGNTPVERMRIASTGNVGIGTTAPGSKLTIGPSFATTNGFTIDTADSSHSQIIARKTSSKTAFGVLAWDTSVFLSAGIYYEGGAWVQGNHNGTNQLFTLTPGDGVRWYASNNGSGSWNVSSDTQLWDDAAIWTSLVRSTRAGNSYFTGGNVGIGTTSPGYKLDVAGAINSTTATTSGTGTLNLGTTVEPRIAGQITGTQSPSYSSTGKLGFSVTTWGVGSDYGLTEVMAIDMRGADSKAPTIWMNPFGGNVGIGTTTPVSIGTGITTLDIQGSNAGGVAFGPSGVKNYIYGASTMYVEAHTTAVFTTSGSEKMRLTTGGQLIVGGTTVGYSGTKLQVGNTSDSQNGLNILTSTTGYGYILFGDGAGADAYVGQIWYYHGDNYMGFQTNGGERMRITSSGNVGIGTTSPSNKFVAVNDATFDGENTYSIAAAASSDTGYKTVIGYDYANDIGVISAVRQGIQWKNLSILPVGNTNLGVGTITPSQRLHVSGNIRVTGAYYDSNNSAGSSGQVLSSTGSGTDWVTPATTTATSLYDLLPAARVAYDWTVQMTSGTWADIFSSNTVLSNGTWMVQVYVSDFASGGQQYQETYSGVMSWGNASSTNETGPEAMSEVVLHRSGHAANSGNFYLRTQERASSTLLLQGMVNYSHTSNTTINFKFVKVF